MKGKYYTFIVRIHGESKNKFRGQIQHIHTQEEAHFDNFKDMKAFMVKHFDLPGKVAPKKDNSAGGNQLNSV